MLDEVGALVYDIGSASIRAGYAGEDMPKVGRTLYRMTHGVCLSGTQGLHLSCI